MNIIYSFLFIKHPSYQLILAFAVMLDKLFYRFLIFPFIWNSQIFRPEVFSYDLHVPGSMLIPFFIRIAFPA